MTRGRFDVVKVLGTDEKAGWLYYIASPDHPAQRYLYRARLDGKGIARAAVPRGPSRAPTATTWRPTSAMRCETYSSFGNPPAVRLVRLPGHQVIRTLIDNAGLRAIAWPRSGRGPSSSSA